MATLLFFILVAVTAPESTPEEKAAMAQKREADEKLKAEEKAKEEAQKAAEDKAKQEAEDKVKREAEAQKAADEKAKQEAEAKAKKLDEIKNPNWNKEDMYGDSNGNMELAAKLLTVAGDIKTIAKSPKPGAVMKAPWNYYGQVVAINATVDIVQDYPPSHNFSEILRGTASQIVLGAEDGTSLYLFMPIASGNLQVGQNVTIFGYPVGLVEVDNQLGGKTSGLMLVGNQVQIH